MATQQGTEIKIETLALLNLQKDLEIFNLRQELEQIKMSAGSAKKGPDVPTPQGPLK